MLLFLVFTLLGRKALQPFLLTFASALANVCVRIRNYFLTLSLLLAFRWRTMIISELRRIIGWFWVAQANKCILCTMYVRKKHNRSGSTSVVVVSKASGKYREIKSGSSEIITVR